MFPRLSPFLDFQFKNRKPNEMFGMIRWNQYAANWSLVVEALRRLWETGKASELKSPFYEPLEPPVEPPVNK